MLGAIVLRDIPKEEVRIDLARMAIRGGFRGFSQVPAAAWHYVSVKEGETHQGFWFWLEPGEALVRVFDYAAGFQEDEPESAATFAQMARNGAMGPALWDYPHELFGPWYGLVQHIPQANFPPPIHDQDSGAGKRFDNALQATHGGSGAALLAEFQYAFVAWLVSLDGAAADERAFARWRHLLLAAYNAGEYTIAANSELFARLADVILRQYPLLPAEWFAPDSFISSQAGYLAEDLQDCGAPELAEKGRQLAAALAARQDAAS